MDLDATPGVLHRRNCDHIVIEAEIFRPHKANGTSLKIRLTSPGCEWLTLTIDCRLYHMTFIYVIGMLTICTEIDDQQSLWKIINIPHDYTYSGGSGGSGGVLDCSRLTMNQNSKQEH
jgi:hypothetical protein